MLLLTLFVFLLILSILVLIHEAGHFLAAKYFGIKVEEFGFGLPPRLWGKKKGETIYSINWLPIGGFVKLYGEEEESKSSTHNHTDQKRAFYSRPIWQKIIVLIAGVSMNFVLAVSIISFLFTQGVVVPTDRVHIEKILPNSPAQMAGLKEKDVIKRFTINSLLVDVKTAEDVVKFTREHLGQEVMIVFERDGQEKFLPITPRKEYPKDEGPLGISISTFEEKKYPLLTAPIYGTKESLVLSWYLTKGIGQTVWKLVTFQPIAKDVAGPIGIVQMTGQAIKFGNLAILELLGLLSLNLAIVNILPFPALDGGRLLFVMIEALTGKKIKTNWEKYIHQLGMALLLALMIVITINDIIRLFAK